MLESDRRSRPPLAMLHRVSTRSTPGRQRARMVNDAWNFYQDHASDPESPAAEAVGRANLLALVAEGYDGRSAAEIRAFHPPEPYRGKGVRYDSDAAVELAGQISEFLSDRAHRASEELAAQRGRFPNWEGSVWDTVHHRPMRNATCTTIAPTGSIGIIAGCSSGVEPVFSLAGKRRALDGGEYISIHPLLERLGRQEGWIDDRVRKDLLAGKPPCDIAPIPKRLAESLVIAHDVPPEIHVRIQAAFQKHIDNAVSKTVNLPADAAVHEVDAVFRLAHQLGCKGVTVYRDRSRTGQVLESAAPARPARGKVAAPAGSPAAAGGRPTMGIEPRPRARSTRGSTTRFRMGCGTLFVTANRDDLGLCEVLATLGRAGGCPSQTEATCRVTSLALRAGVTPDAVLEQLKGIRCLSTCTARVGKSDIDVLSCPDAIARAIEEALAAEPVNVATAGPIAPLLMTGRPCPLCKSAMRRSEGCMVCDNCGHSSCG